MVTSFIEINDQLVIVKTAKILIRNGSNCKQHKFVHNMINSKNSTIRELIAHFLTIDSTVFAENCGYLMYKYDISVFVWNGSLYDVMNCIKNIQYLSNEHACNIYHLFRT